MRHSAMELSGPQTHLRLLTMGCLLFPETAPEPNPYRRNLAAPDHRPASDFKASGRPKPLRCQVIRSSGSRQSVRLAN